MKTNKELFQEFGNIYNQILIEYKEVSKYYFSLLAEAENNSKLNNLDKELEALIEDKPYYPNLDNLISVEDQDFILSVLDKNKLNVENPNYQLLAKGLISSQIKLIEDILDHLDSDTLNQQANKKLDDLNLLFETFEVNNYNLEVVILDLIIDLNNLNKSYQLLTELKSKLIEE